MCNSNCVCQQDNTASRGAAIPIVSSGDLSWLKRGLEEGKYKERERILGILLKYEVLEPGIEFDEAIIDAIKENKEQDEEDTN